MTKTTTHTTKYRHFDNQDNSLTLEVEFTYFPGDPGKLTGPPENSYPAEPAEVEITSIRLASTSTPRSRNRSRYFGHFTSGTPTAIITEALSQLNTSTKVDPRQPVSTFITWLYNCLEALNHGGFIGPEQRLIPVDISELLSDEIISDIEAKCFKAIEDQAREGCK